MHLLLTDRLTCPRCGPEFGLILLAHELADRLVQEGVLGCPNCRDGFPIQAGFGDLRAPPRRGLEAGLAGAFGSHDAAEAERIAALIGVARGPGTVALVGGLAGHGSAISCLTEDLQIVGIDADLSAWPADPSWSRIVSRPGMPFFSRTLRGVGLDGRLGRRWIDEAARVVAPMSRVVVTDATGETCAWLEEAGLKVMVDEEETVVAARS
ncbi:MAG: hypothetical protein IIB36_12500 [Gemmatimonadetes bacterium]|nr:hypothetical protein [Gemmatimonadota bacterium]